MFTEVYKLQAENLKLQRELSDAQRDLVRELSKQRPPSPCACLELQPAVLFKVTTKQFSYKYGRVPGWLTLGYTNDLSKALAYHDMPGCAWINVQRGFIDKHGQLYDAARNLVSSLGKA